VGGDECRRTGRDRAAVTELRFWVYKSRRNGVDSEPRKDEAYPNLNERKPAEQIEWIGRISFSAKREPDLECDQQNDNPLERFAATGRVHVGELVVNVAQRVELANHAAVPSL